jgi:aspartyl-tRNA(Asn)/glutamyl-tRNA(Gln) amidotransferase subunit A
VLGKTHMTEIAFSGLGYNPMTATPPCVDRSGRGSGGVIIWRGNLSRLVGGGGFRRVGHGRIGSGVPSVWNDLVG